METLVNSASILILVGLAVFPFFLSFFLRKTSQKTRFVKFLVIGVGVTGLVMLTGAWWDDQSTSILLKDYGYDLRAENEMERFSNVETANLFRVKQLVHKYFGIGWPLKAIFGFCIYLPYLFIVYFMGNLINKTRV